MPHVQVIAADLTWTGDRFEPHIQVEVDPAGSVTRVGPLGLTPTTRLPNQALLPGLVNAHSHAFQRGLRGRGERFPRGAGSFWTWREAMYRLVESLEPDAFHTLCRQAFAEMLDAGITAVGEFHYLHHSPAGPDYAFDDLVLQAARDAGIRIVLLNTYYATGGIGRPLGSAQRRFATTTPAEYWEQMDRLARVLSAEQRLGAVVHSLRAAGLDDITALQREAARRGLVLHMHVEEQRQEIEECVTAYGRRPMELLLDVLESATNVTAVHCTHTTPDDLAEFVEAGGRVCVCPLTEANLGDGLPDLGPVHAGGDRLCLGTDSNTRISLIEEMRWLELGQRLRSETRGVLADAEGSVARTVFRAATAGGAAALGVAAGVIAPGHLADFAAVDLTHPTLANSDPENLLDAFIFGSENAAVRATCVGGHWRDRNAGQPY